MLQSKHTFIQSLRSLTVKRQLSIPTYNVAIVGSGPAGFYTAHHILNKSSSEFKLNVDIFDRLPTPYGLSRYGVAPDHPEVKNCEEYLDNLIEKFPWSKDSANNSVRFFGNVNVGETISLADLQSNYHSIVLSYGCTSSDNHLRVEGSQLPGVIPARQFVNWYNGHPDSYSSTNPFVPPDLTKIEDVTIIGNGNVALDVARVLLADPESHWASTDICSEAMKLLKQSSVKRVNIVARRGLLESAFSNKEIRELLELSKENIKFLPIEDSVFEEIEPLTKNLGRVDKRKVSILTKYSTASKKQTVESNDKVWSLGYLKSPIEFTQSSSDPNLLQQTKFKVNKLHHDPLTKVTTIVPSENSEIETIKNELVILSIGYQGSPLIGFDELDISFDKNRILNHEGRILLKSSGAGEEPHNFKYKKGWYTSGWIKKGPKGVIATTMMEAFETADQVLEDLTNDIHTGAKSPVDITELLAGNKTVDWQGWTKINEYEVQQGSKLGKPRDKIYEASKLIDCALT